jgi:hypothetical protein
MKKYEILNWKRLLSQKSISLEIVYPENWEKTQPFLKLTI